MVICNAKPVVEIRHNIVSKRKKNRFLCARALLNKNVIRKCFQI